jgi:haloalkane dehalogenase
VATTTVLDSWLHHLEVGEGPPVLFLHGNPTSSYLWRHVLGPVAEHGQRCLALDLIGMGGSGEPALDYRFADHAAYVEAFLDAVDLPRCAARASGSRWCWRTTCSSSRCCPPAWPTG